MEQLAEPSSWGTGYLLVGLGLIAAAVDWIAVATGARRLEYVFKPLTLGLLVAAALVLGSDESEWRRWFTVAALGLSLVGDVVLVLPRDPFLAGLAAFLLAHVAYALAFNETPPPFVITALAAYGVAVTGGIVYQRLLEGMRRRDERAMAFPVALYVVALGAVVVSAVATARRPEWDGLHAAVAITGAGLFMVSDVLLGWSRFVRTWTGAPLPVNAAYHLAQVGLLLGLLG